MRRLLQLLRQPEFHVFLFCLLFLPANWPFLAIPAKNGLMSLFIYLFALYSIVILVLFIIQRSLRSNRPGEDGDKEGGD